MASNPNKSLNIEVEGLAPHTPKNVADKLDDQLFIEPPKQRKPNDDESPAIQARDIQREELDKLEELIPDSRAHAGKTDDHKSNGRSANKHNASKGSLISTMAFGKKGGMKEITARIEKVEKYLHDRFNWLNEPSGEVSKSTTPKKRGEL